MAADKTLVIGSTGHAHVRCVEWRDALNVNIVDFARVLVNCRPLTSEFLNAFKSDFFEKLRIQFTRLLDSGGEIVALGIASQRATKSLASRLPDDTYSWSPIDIVTVEEAGDSIEILETDFASLLTKMQRWRYWYRLSQSCLTRELVAYYGGAAEMEFHIDTHPLATNRYKRPLAVMFTASVRSRKVDHGDKLGPLILLPDVPELDSREAVNLVLEDLGFPQTTLPPEWAEGLIVPGVPKLTAEIAGRNATIEKLEEEILALESQKTELEWYRKLLYESGTELERVFSTCLEKMGGTISPAKYSQEEFVLDFEGRRSLVECKGVAKSAQLTHLRQLTSYMLQYQEDEGVAGHGVLFVNAWRTLRPSEREDEATPTFPPNVIEQATQFGIALVSSIEFFAAFCRFAEGEVGGPAILRKVATTNGVVEFT
jgi:hypothetical protein